MARPFTSTLAGLLDRSLLFVGGKGGVGKTTIAAALGLAAANRGRRCLVVSTDPAHSLGDALGVRVGPSERKIADRLWALEIDPDAEAAVHIASVKQQMKSLAHPRMHAEVDRQLDLAALAPGTTEAALLERMAELMAEAGHRFDLVVFDTAPTGHTLRLLALPEIMMTWTDGLLRHDERASKLSAALKRFGGAPAGDELSLMGDVPAAVDSRNERLTRLLRARQQKLRVARDDLLDRDNTGFVLVVNADKLSVLETGKAFASLTRARVPVAALIVNRVLPPEGGGPFLDARRRQEAPHLRAIEKQFGDLPRATVPLMPDDPQGIEALGDLSRLLAGHA
jgi:arsenite-transporting ATPase